VLAHEIHLAFLSARSFIDGLNGTQRGDVELCTEWAAWIVCDFLFILATGSHCAALKVLMRE
jgi:hypothetical protein